MKKETTNGSAIAPDRSAPARKDGTRPQVSAETINGLLAKTDLEAHSRRVAEYVAKTAEEYRRASARAVQECGQIVLV